MHLCYLSHMIELELSNLEARKIGRLIKVARFPILNSFDFDAIPAL